MTLGNGAARGKIFIAVSYAVGVYPAGVEQARRDDLEGLGYVLLYFLRGSLPWQGLKATSKRDKYSKITHTKMSVDLHALCAGLPQCFTVYMTYCRALHFGDPPNHR